MPKDNARRVLANPNATIAEIEAAIVWLESDITYVQKFHPFISPELQASVEESRSLLSQLQDKLNSQNK